MGFIWTLATIEETASIIGHALKFAWTHGHYNVMLQTGPAREATHNFYKSCGFAADDKFAFVARQA